MQFLEDKTILTSFECCLFHTSGTDLAQRFSDQFFPLQVSSSLSWARPDATILRLPLRSSKQAAESKFKDAVECTDTDVARILDNFKSRASSGLLALKTVEDVRLPSYIDPVSKLALMLDLKYVLYGFCSSNPDLRSFGFQC